ncbi:MAG: HAD family hydrolase [Lacrimispora sp.]|uniref:HAD family hydrolase n=1 Tax=Lacrimispora sp. TaxID=2719234 RepID=UPI0039E51AF8
MNNQHFIFDLDGTLWDATTIIATSWNKTLSADGRYTKEITSDLLKKEFGKTISTIADNIFSEFEKSTRDELIEKCLLSQERDLQLTANRIIYPHVLETLRALSERNNIYIVSNCQSGYIELFIDKYNLKDLVTDIECFGNTGKCKADNIVSLMKRNNIKDAFYIGDTMGDCEAAAKAGIPFIHASYGYGEVNSCYLKITEISQLLSLSMNPSFN